MLTVAATGILLASIQPVQAVAVFAAIAVSETLIRVRSKDVSRIFLKQILILSLPILGVSAYMYSLLSLMPHMQTKIWEATQHSYTTPVFLILSLGPVAFLAVPGAISRLKGLASPELAGLILIFTGYVMFISRIPQAIGISNSRLLFPAFYVFWGVFAAYGGELFGKMIRRIIPISEKTGITAVTLIFVVLSLPTLLWEVNLKLTAANDASDPIVYLPREVSEGFRALERLGSPDDVVLASPSRHMDSLVPALSGHTTYSGHLLATIDNAGKQDVARRFFALQLDRATAVSWIEKEKIRFVLLTRFDGDRRAFESAYQFLKPLFANSEAAVYEAAVR
jgi:hypothetical protein